MARTDCPIRRASGSAERQLFDVGTDRFGHAETVEREERDKRVVARAGETGDDEDCA
jgi:hypothetical protein